MWDLRANNVVARVYKTQETHQTGANIAVQHNSVKDAIPENIGIKFGTMNGYTCNLWEATPHYWCDMDEQVKAFFWKLSSEHRDDLFKKAINTHHNLNTRVYNKYWRKLRRIIRTGLIQTQEEMLATQKAALRNTFNEWRETAKKDILFDAENTDEIMEQVLLDIMSDSSNAASPKAIAQDEKESEWNQGDVGYFYSMRQSNFKVVSVDKKEKVLVVQPNDKQISFRQAYHHNSKRPVLEFSMTQ